MRAGRMHRSNGRAYRCRDSRIEARVVVEYFQILFHGRFAARRAGKLDHGLPYEGFYTSRIIDSFDLDDAVTRGRELIRKELDATLLSGRQDALAVLEVEECRKIDVDQVDMINRKGFTFY